VPGCCQDTGSSSGTKHQEPQRSLKSKGLSRPSPERDALVLTGRSPPAPGSARKSHQSLKTWSSGHAAESGSAASPGAEHTAGLHRHSNTFFFIFRMDQTQPLCSTAGSKRAACLRPCPLAQPCSWAAAPRTSVSPDRQRAGSRAGCRRQGWVQAGTAGCRQQGWVQAAGLGTGRHDWVQAAALGAGCRQGWVQAARLDTGSRQAGPGAGSRAGYRQAGRKQRWV